MDLMINATRGQIEEFKESVLWADIRRELTIWKRGFAAESKSIVNNAYDDNPSTAVVLMHLGDINGREKATDYMLNILDMFLQILEEKKDDSEHK